MRRTIFFLTVLATAIAVNAQKADVEVKTGQFSPDWESLDSWQCPEWFKDAKFGIWAHWGPQCHAEDGDWYARFMYYEGSGQNQWHYDHFGDPAIFGFKDLCNDWKAQNWDPEKLVSLYKSVGARYFMALGNHHDNFDLWDSPYQEWNSVNIGPKKDIIKGWSNACKKAGIPLGISIHASHAWTWFEPSTEYDGNLTKEDGYKLDENGNEYWWKGLDPQELYAQRHDHSTGWDESGNIHNQWEWGNGASQPSDAYKQKFQNRVLELIDDYNPDMIYFDDTAMPFYGCDEEIGKNILAHYYNTSAEQNGNTPNVVVTGKQLTKDQKKHMMWDVERGIPDAIQEDYWQTCTCLGNWHYEQGVYNNNSYKSAQQVVNMLADIVSKNGNMLLSVPVKSDGTIDDKEEAILAQIKAWMDINSVSVYGTRTWKTFGEGPLAESAHVLSGQGFNEGNNYSSKDVAYCQRNDTLFATIMRWPASDTFKFKSLGLGSEYYSGKVKSVKLLGYGEVEFQLAVDGLIVALPETHPNELGPVFQIVFDEDSSSDISLAEVIEAYEAKVVEMFAQSSYNTGKFSKNAVKEFKQKLEDAKQYVNESEANQKVMIATLGEAYNDLIKNGINKAGAPEGNALEDQTIMQLVEASNFSASEIGTRFGTPQYWTVENFTVPVNTGAGVKNGIDAYPGYNTLCLGVWSGEDVEPYTSDITNARIYRKIHLDAGRYYFGAKYEANYNVSDNAFIFAADKVLATEQVEEQSIAYARINEANGVGGFYGIQFTINEEQDVVIGFQANMADGSNQQEFRVKEITFLYYGDMNFDALDNLVLTADQIMSEATVNSNTGFYKKEAVEKLQAAMDAAQEIDPDSSYEEFMEAYNALQAAIKDFQENGKNVGGAPIETGCEDITIEKLHEAKDFARTPETDDGDRFGAPLYWTVENFGFDDEAGIDSNPGYDCLHLEVWWNNSAFPEHGYDIENVRLYQTVDLPAGRYFFGGAYPTAEANEELYIFASEEIVNTDEISTKSIAYEKVNLAPAGDSFRGIYFTLEEAKTIHLGWQADFSDVSTNNLRCKAVKLLYYGELSYEKLQGLIENIEEKAQAMKVNENTGFYSKDAYETLQAAIETARQVSSSADYDTISDAYNALNDAFTLFEEQGKNPGGQPSKLNATDVTEQYLVEASEFSRLDPSVTTRFATPKYWTVENFQIPNGGDGVKNGIDKYPGYDCLSIGIWDDLGNNEDGDASSARVYRTVHLDAGKYYFGATYNTTYNLSNQAYIFAADEVMPTDEIPTNSIAYYPINKAADNDGLFHGINFTLTESQDVVLGFQVNLKVGSGEQEFRARQVLLYSYSAADGIEDMAIDVNGGQTIFNNGIFNLAGQKVDTNYKGIIIVNGKKYLNK